MGQARYTATPKQKLTQDSSRTILLCVGSVVIVVTNTLTAVAARPTRQGAHHASRHECVMHVTRVDGGGGGQRGGDGGGQRGGGEKGVVLMAYVRTSTCCYSTQSACLQNDHSYHGAAMLTFLTSFFPLSIPSFPSLPSLPPPSFLSRLSSISSISGAFKTRTRQPSSSVLFATRRGSSTTLKAKAKKR